MSNYYAINNTDILEHHGILGQKWGVRRYQNPDGTLTSAGRARRAKIDEEASGYEAKAKESRKYESASRKDYDDLKKNGVNSKVFTDEYNRLKSNGHFNEKEQSKESVLRDLKSYNKKNAEINKFDAEGWEAKANRTRTQNLGDKTIGELEKENRNIALGKTEVATTIAGMVTYKLTGNAATTAKVAAGTAIVSGIVFGTKATAKNSTLVEETKSKYGSIVSTKKTGGRKSAGSTISVNKTNTAQNQADKVKYYKNTYTDAFEKYLKKTTGVGYDQYDDTDLVQLIAYEYENETGKSADRK